MLLLYQRAAFPPFYEKQTKSATSTAFIATLFASYIGRCIFATYSSTVGTLMYLRTCHVCNQNRLLSEIEIDIGGFAALLGTYYKDDLNHTYV